MRQYVFDNSAFNDFCNSAIHDKKIFSKICELLKSINRTTNEGFRKTEPLKFNQSGNWSRRINQEHRLVYKVDDKNIYIASFRGHYL
jgi:toxin YoeB